MSAETHKAAMEKSLIGVETALEQYCASRVEYGKSLFRQEHVEGNILINDEEKEEKSLEKFAKNEEKKKKNRENIKNRDSQVKRDAWIQTLIEKTKSAREKEMNEKRKLKTKVDRAGI